MARLTNIWFSFILVSYENMMPYLFTGSTVKSDALGCVYGQTSDPLSGATLNRFRGARMKHAVGSPDSFLQETRQWLSRGLSAMWVNQFKEQRKHRICKSQLSLSQWHDPFSTNMMWTWAILFVTEPSSQCTQTSIIDYRPSSELVSPEAQSLTWRMQPSETYGKHAYTSECVLALHLHKALFLLLFWQKLTLSSLSVSMVILFFSRFSHFFSLFEIL